MCVCVCVCQCRKVLMFKRVRFFSNIHFKSGTRPLTIFKVYWRVNSIKTQYRRIRKHILTCYVKTFERKRRKRLHIFFSNFGTFFPLKSQVGASPLSESARLGHCPIRPTPLHATAYSGESFQVLSFFFLFRPPFSIRFPSQL